MRIDPYYPKIGDLDWLIANVGPVIKSTFSEDEGQGWKRRYRFDPGAPSVVFQLVGYLIIDNDVLATLYLLARAGDEI